MGSSPHTRGTLVVLGGRGCHAGIIPAYAGNTLEPPRRICPHGIIPAYAGNTGCSRPSQSARWDHPRIRGEHRYLPVPPVWHTGSSPHTRGTQLVLAAMLVARGIIPAYAGNTRRHTRRSPRSRDHPRIRGEHTRSDLIHARQTGSSPHTRGTPPKRSSPQLHNGIIPAYAGNTAGAWSTSRTGRDHPRIRGEHLMM